MIFENVLSISQSSADVRSTLTAPILSTMRSSFRVPGMGNDERLLREKPGERDLIALGHSPLPVTVHGVHGVSKFVTDD